MTHDILRLYISSAEKKKGNNCTEIVKYDGWIIWTIETNSFSKRT